MTPTAASAAMELWLRNNSRVGYTLLGPFEECVIVYHCPFSKVIVSFVVEVPFHAEGERQDR